MRFCDIHLRTLLQWAPKLLFCIRSLNNILLKSSPHFPGDKWVNSLTMFGHHPWPFPWPQICIWTHLKLDESIARRHLKSPQSLSGRFLDLILVTKWSWSWSWKTFSHPLVQCELALPFWDTDVSKFDHQNPWWRPCMWSQVKVTFDLENSKVKVMA